MKAASYLRNGETLVLRESDCVGCGACIEVCPHAVFELEQGLARIVDRGACMECGACALNCPAKALSVTAGVGCAAAIIIGKLKGVAPTCGGDGGCCGGAADGAKGAKGAAKSKGCC